MGATRGAITLALLAAGVLASQRTYSPQSPWITRTEWSYAYASNRTSREQPLTMQVQNPHGGISIIVKPSTELEIRSSSPHRESTAEDVAIARVENVYQVVVRPADGAPIDLQIFIPYGAFVEAATIAGPINYTGFGEAALQTGTGAVSLTAPLEATRFELLSRQPPGKFTGDAFLQKTDKFWVARDRLSDDRITYGQLTLKAERPESVTLKNMAIPEDSAVKMHWQAEELLPNLFRRFSDGLKNRDRPEEAATNPSTSADFSADTRLVQLEVSVTDNEGYPITGLAIDDFEVIEDGETQPLVHIDSAEQPFNLVLLLDASSSTEGDRDDIEEAARRFIGIARENDKIAVYTLADTLFQVLSTLTTDRELARNSAGLIATFGGATPLYDIIVLSYAHELAKLPRERNAIVILSDGIDNALYKWGVGPGFHKIPAKAVERRRDAIVPSKVSFEQVRKAAQEMDAMIYPVLLDSAVSAARSQPARYENVRRWSLTAHGQARELADASGGRVFAARSVRDLEGVYEQVARDLRSIYTLNYRPTNQNLDGNWRRVRVKIANAKSTVRSRPGYYAY